jgi:hypothetical protein
MNGGAAGRPIQGSARRRQLWLILGAAAIVIAVVIVVALALRPGPAASNEVSIDVVLRTPAEATMHTTSGDCLVLEDRLMLLESADAVALVDGTSISVTLSQGTYRPAPDASPDQLTVDVRIASALEDGTPTETWMGSDATSAVTVTGAAREGSVEFSGLVLRPGSELRSPIDVAGSISWSCEPRS